MSNHDLTKLSGRINAAADAIEEYALLQGVPSTNKAEYNADTLRWIANDLVMAEEERALVEELAVAMYNVTIGADDWTSTTELTKESYRIRAEKLIDDGWRK